MRKQLERRARNLDIMDSVVFLGERPHEEIAFWMNVADCLCVPSRSEGMPNVVLEALVSGLPVVAADVGGCRELLAQEPSSLLVRANSAEALTEALNTVSDSGLETSRRDLAQRHKERFSWSKAAQRICELMETR